MGRSYIIVRPVAPFRLDLTAWALRRRSQNLVDHWDDGVYRRVLVVGDERIAIAVRQGGSAGRPALRVKSGGEGHSAACKAAVRQLVEKLLGTQIGLGDFYRLAARDRHLGPIVERYSGVKPPRFTSVFEAAVNGICCQQLSLTVGIVLLNRLAAACSEAVDNEGEAMHAFPRPEEVAGLTMIQLRRLGLNTNKAKALLELSGHVAEGRVDLEGLSAMDDEEAIAELVKLRGLGRWTAEYVLLRGLGRVHIYPGDDIGFQNGLRRWLDVRGGMDRRVVQGMMSQWPRFGGLVYFHLLLERLRRENLIA